MSTLAQLKAALEIEKAIAGTLVDINAGGMPKDSAATRHSCLPAAQDAYRRMQLLELAVKEAT